MTNHMIWNNRCSHVHIRPAGSGVHIPLDAQVAVILVDGKNIELQPNKITAPSVVLWLRSIEPFLGGVGSPQLTGERQKFNEWYITLCCVLNIPYNNLNKINQFSSMNWSEYVNYQTFQETGKCMNREFWKCLRTGRLRKPTSNFVQVCLPSCR